MTVCANSQMHFELLVLIKLGKCMCYIYCTFHRYMALTSICRFTCLPHFICWHYLPSRILFCLLSFSPFRFFFLLTLIKFFHNSGMGPDFRVLVRKSRKQAEQYHRLYKVFYFVKLLWCIISSKVVYVYSSCKFLLLNFLASFLVIIYFFMNLSIWFSSWIHL